MSQLEELIGGEDANRLKDANLYTKPAPIVLSIKLILADTKFEFGTIDGQLIIADEMLTLTRRFGTYRLRPGN